MTQFKVYNRYYCLIILSILLSISNLIKGQEDSPSYQRLTNFPVFSINAFEYANSGYKTPNGEGHIKMSELNTSIQLAFPLKEKKLYLYNKVNYAQFNFNTDYNRNNANEQFNSIALSMGLIVVLKNHWRLFGIITPTLASDFENALSKEDLLTQASVIATKRANHNYEYGFGLALSTRFGRELVIPLATLTYKKNKWSTLMVLPAYLSQYYEINNTRVGLKMSTFGNIYNLSTSPSPQLEMDKLGYSRITIGPDIGTKLFGSFYLNINSGLAVRNRLESINHKQKIEMKLSMQEKFFFNIGLSLIK